MGAGQPELSPRPGRSPDAHPGYCRARKLLRANRMLPHSIVTLLRPQRRRALELARWPRSSLRPHRESRAVVQELHNGGGANSIEPERRLQHLVHQLLVGRAFERVLAECSHCRVLVGPYREFALGELAVGDV